CKELTRTSNGRPPGGAPLPPGDLQSPFSPRENGSRNRHPRAFTRARKSLSKGFENQIPGTGHGEPGPATRPRATGSRGATPGGRALGDRTLGTRPREAGYGTSSSSGMPSGKSTRK